MFIMFSPSRRTLKPAPHESPSRQTLKLYPHETSPSTTLNTLRVLCLCVFRKQHPVVDIVITGNLPAVDKELKSSRPEFFQKPLRSIGIRGTDLVTDYFWEQLDIFMDPQAREKQMKMDETVDIIRKRFGFYSVQRGLMYRDRILSACDAKSDHTVHPHGYFG